jgi:hypothetical protein
VRPNAPIKTDRWYLRYSVEQFFAQDADDP